MKLITPAEAALPDVRLIIPRAKFNALPESVRELLAYFAVDVATGRYQMPGYRYADIEREVSHILEIRP